MDGDPGPTDEGDDVTDPGTSIDVPEADRAEQEALLDPPAVSLAGEASAPPEDVPEADALEQQLAARPGEAGSDYLPTIPSPADNWHEDSVPRRTASVRTCEKANDGGPHDGRDDC